MLFCHSPFNSSVRFLLLLLPPPCQMTLIFRDFSLLQEDGSTKIGSLYIDQATGLIIQPTNQTEGIQEVLPLPNGFLRWVSPLLSLQPLGPQYLHVKRAIQDQENSSSSCMAFFSCSLISLQSRFDRYPNQWSLPA